MEGVFLPGFGDVGRKGPRNEGHDVTIMAGKGDVGSQLLLNPLVGGELAQTLGDLSAVLDHEEPQVGIPWAEYEVVHLPDLFRGGSEWEEGVGKARAGDFPDDAVEVAWVGADGGHLCRLGVDFVILGQHFRCC